MIELLEPKSVDQYFLARVCRDASLLYEQLMPGIFEKQAVRFESSGLPKEYDILIIYFNNVPVGFLGDTSISCDTIYLAAFYLLDKYQNKGIGVQVLNLYINQLRKKGILKILLVAHREASWAINFYNKNEFIKIDKEEDVIKEHSILHNYLTHNTVLMCRYL